MKVKSLLKSVGSKTSKPRSARAAEAEACGALHEPVRYILSHLGSMPVDEETANKRYRDGIGASAVRTIVVMAKSAHKKGVEVKVDITASKIRVMENASQKVLVDSPIQRVCFCTCDGVYNKVFAFIYRVPEKETMECHAFYCGAPQVAQSIALAMNGAFIAALEREQRVQQQMREQNAFPVSIPVYPSRHCTITSASSAYSSTGSTHSHSEDSGAATSLRSAKQSPCESDSASLTSTRSGNYSSDSAACEQLSPAQLVDQVAKQIARNLLVSHSVHCESRSETASQSSRRGQLVHTAQVHLPPSEAAQQGCTKKGWSSTDDIQDCESSSALPLRCAPNYSCVLPVAAAATS